MAKKLKYKTQGLFSEPKNFCIMTGLEFGWSDNKKLLYVFPMNTKGSHDLRWFTIPRGDIKAVIKMLEEHLK